MRIQKSPVMEGFKPVAVPQRWVEKFSRLLSRDSKKNHQVYVKGKHERIPRIEEYVMMNGVSIKERMDNINEFTN
jgi:hypothetical protein